MTACLEVEKSWQDRVFPSGYSIPSTALWLGSYSLYQKQVVLSCLSTAEVISVQIAFQGGHPNFKDLQSVLRSSYGRLRWGTRTPWELSSADFEGCAPLGFGVKLVFQVSLWGLTTIRVSHVNWAQYQRHVCCRYWRRARLLLPKSWPKFPIESSIPLF